MKAVVAEKNERIQSLERKVNNQTVELTSKDIVISGMRNAWMSVKRSFDITDWQVCEKTSHDFMIAN